MSTRWNAHARQVRAMMDIARTRPEALARVASHVAGLLTAGEFEEATGLDITYLTEAEQDRYLKAVDELQRRLYAMMNRLEKKT